MIGCIILTVLLGIMGIWNLTVAIIGLFPKFHATAVGTLESSHTERNVRMRGWTIPVRTHYTYVYTVKGRKYKHRGSVESSRKYVPQKAHLVYVKWFPWSAYRNKFSGGREWCLGIFGIFTAVMFTAVLLFA